MKRKKKQKKLHMTLKIDSTWKKHGGGNIMLCGSFLWTGNLVHGATTAQELYLFCKQIVASSNPRSVVSVVVLLSKTLH